MIKSMYHKYWIFTTNNSTSLKVDFIISCELALVIIIISKDSKDVLLYKLSYIDCGGIYIQYDRPHI